MARISVSIPDKPNPQTQTIVECAQLAIQGKSYRDIAQRFGLSHVAIHKKLKTPLAKKILESAHAHQLRLLPLANKILTALLVDTDPKIRLEAVKLVHKNTGITPAQATPFFIQQINNIQSTVMSESALRMLASYIGSDPDDTGDDSDTVDGELITPD